MQLQYYLLRRISRAPVHDCRKLLKMPATSLFSIRSSTVNSTGKSITGGAASILHASIAITLYQIRDPSFPPAHGPTGLPVAACSLYLALGLRGVVPQALESVKGSLLSMFWERTQRIPNLIGKEESFVMQHTSSRCIGVTGVHII